MHVRTSRGWPYITPVVWYKHAVSGLTRVKQTTHHHEASLGYSLCLTVTTTASALRACYVTIGSDRKNGVPMLAIFPL